MVMVKAKCGGPKGNKHALGNDGGRPPKYDREQVAKNLVEWAKKPTSINLCGFCITHEPQISPPYLSRWANECDEFKQTYELAKAYLGQRREELLTQDLLHVKAYDLNATTYDYFLKQEKREQIKFESDMKKEENAAIPPRQNEINMEDEFIRLRARNAELEAKLANQQ